jgi:hypothetical protein
MLDADDTLKVSIAMNGKKGRRVGCVMFCGAEEVGIWDMEMDEGDEVEEEGEGEEAEEGEDEQDG